MHVVVDRGVDAVLGQVTAVLETYTDKAQLMYKRSATDVVSESQKGRKG